MDNTIHKVKSFTFVEDDILFDCPVCGKALIVDRDGVGMEIACPQCQSMLRVPERPDPNVPLPSGALVSSESVGQTVETTHHIKTVEKPDINKRPTPPPSEDKASQPVPVPPPGVSTAGQGVDYIFDPKSLENLDDDKLRDRFNEIKHLVKENHSQRLEVSEYISHANLKLQRETLKLKRLEAKRLEFEKELNFLKSKVGDPDAS